MYTYIYKYMCSVLHLCTCTYTIYTSINRDVYTKISIYVPGINVVVTDVLHISLITYESTADGNICLIHYYSLGCSVCFHPLGDLKNFFPLK